MVFSNNMEYDNNLSNPATWRNFLYRIPSKKPLILEREDNLTNNILSEFWWHTVEKWVILKDTNLVELKNSPEF
jgi:hypothetical protein